MNRKLYTLFAVLTITCSAFYSCGGDDDTSYGPDAEWVAFNDSIYNSIADSVDLNTANDPLKYRSRRCQTGNGNIYYKTIDEFVITPPPTYSVDGISPKISADGYPYFNDSVVVRYEGWYYQKDNTGKLVKTTFDGTESNNQQQGRGFTINSLTAGFRTSIQFMRVGEQVEICVPYNLAYGEYGSGAIPGHTTLFFKILLLRIYPVNPEEFPGANTGQ